MAKKDWGFSREDVAIEEKANAFERSALDCRDTTEEEPIAQKINKQKDTFVFVSYAREDLSAVKPFVIRLRNLGINVVWDQDFCTGVDFEYEIRSSIENATAVTVIWSPHSIRSRFVRDEARLADRDGKLAPIILDNLAISDIPIGFGLLQTTRMSQFDIIQQDLLSRGIRPYPMPA